MNVKEIERQIKIAEGQLKNAGVAYKDGKTERARQLAVKIGNKAKARIAELKAQLEAMTPVQEQPAAPVVMDPAALELQKACDEKLKKLIEAYKVEEEALKQKYAQKKADVYAWFDAAVKALKEQPVEKAEEVKEELSEKKDNEPQTVAPVVEQEVVETVSEEAPVPQEEVIGKVKELFVSAGNFREKIAAVEDPFLVSVVMPITDDIDVINACAEAMMACYEKGIKSIEYQFPSFEVMGAINDCYRQLVYGAQKHDMSCSFVYAGEEAESAPDVPEDALKDNPWMGAPVEEVVGDEPVYEAAASIYEAPEFTEMGESTEEAGYRCHYFDGCQSSGAMAV